MLYIKNSTDITQTIWIPSNGRTLAGGVFSLESVIGNYKVQPFIPSAAVGKGGYCQLTFTLEDTLEEGEYVWTMEDALSGAVLARGVCQVGDFPHDPEEYNKTIEYEQY